MSGNNDDWNDERLTALFAAASGDGPAPDEEVLRRLREESAAVFAKAQLNQPTRRSKMLLYMSRIAAAAIAASIAAVGWFFAAGPAVDASNLGRALDKLAAAGTIHLRVETDGKTAEVWAKPGLLRWNQPDGTYRIARGDHSWTVDEKANRAVEKPATCFHGKKQTLDLLGLVVAANLMGQVDDQARRACSTPNRQGRKHATASTATSLRSASHQTAGH